MAKLRRWAPWWAAVATVCVTAACGSSSVQPPPEDTGTGDAAAETAPDVGVDSRPDVPPPERRGAGNAAAGYLHTCARRPAGDVVCFGSGADGQLGDGRVASTPTPVVVPATAGTLEVAAGSAFTCARLATSVKCWGNLDSSFSDETLSVAARDISGLTEPVQLAAGAAYACAVQKDGGLSCWGGMVPFRKPSVGAAVAISDLPSPAVQVAAGHNFVCVLLADATVACWGSNYSGQLGDGTTDPHSAPLRVAALDKAKQVVASEAGGYGVGHACALVADGAVKCWGYNRYGQLGEGSTTDSPVPVSVSGLTGVVEIAAGPFHNCAIEKDGAVSCWGWNRWGQLGDGTTISRKQPTRVAGLTGAVHLSLGLQHSCAELASGEIRCWGGNGLGQLALPLPIRSKPDAAIAGLSGVVELTAGAGHTCARLTDGSVKCWGTAMDGVVGDGSLEQRPSPVAVAGLIGTKAVSSFWGDTHVCALTSTSTVRCWGSNISGQIGDGTVKPHATPAPDVPAIPTATSVVASGSTSCAAATDKTVRCWGLGSSAYYLKAKAVAGLTDVVQLVPAGNRGACAIKSDASYVCFAMDLTVGPATVVPLFGQLAMGGNFRCTRTTDGAVQCGGQNGHGELGRGTIATDGIALDSAPIPGLSGVVTIGVGSGHSCAATATGIKCWGRNESGQLGDGTSTLRSSPTDVVGATATVQLALGTNHTCALSSDGTVRCWGSFDEGQLGDGTTGCKFSPQKITLP